MKKNNDNTILGIIAVVVLIITIVQAVNNISQVDKTLNRTMNKNSAANGDIKETDIVTQLPKSEGSGASSYGDIGVARICINNPPIWVYDCNMTNLTLNKNQSFSCQLIGADPNGDNVTYGVAFETSPIVFNVSSDGAINFIPPPLSRLHKNIGYLWVADGSGCLNNITKSPFNLTVKGGNAAPYLFKNITNQKIIKNQQFRFYGEDYFTDPDSDPLVYFSIMISGNTIRITFSEGQITVRGSSCGASYAYYVAVDPFGLTAQSNVVRYDVDCPPAGAQSTGGSNQQQQQQQEDQGNGAGQNELCKPSWKCSAWSACQRGNFTYRRCIDYNACDIKNYDHYMFENCTFTNTKHCTEDWECNDWGRCDGSNKKNRLCLDMNTCGTNTTKPAESQNCSIASCYNGIQDNGEIGVDCGGQCPPCKNVETPGKANGPSIIVIIVAALGVGATALLVFAFRAKIVAAYARMFKKKPRLKRKAYINNKQKEKLVLMLNVMQARLDEHKLEQSMDELSVFVREYFKQLLSMETIDKEQLLSKIVKLKDKDLEKVLVMFYAKTVGMIHMHNKGVEFKVSEVQCLIDEISHHIYLIAEFTDEDALSSTKDRVNDGKDEMDMMYTQLSDMYIALKFGELTIAKQMYKDLLKDYEKLSIKDKNLIYADIIRAFHAIDYLEKEYKK